MSILKIVDIKSVEADPNQPRKNFAAGPMASLRASIGRFGIKSPLIVEEAEGGKYVLIDGERRYRAALSLGIREVPVSVEERKSARDRAIEQFHIQEQHENWSSTEKAAVVARLASEIKTTVEKLGSEIGVTPRVISSYIAFGKLRNARMFTDGNVDIRWAESINGLKGAARRASVEGNRVFSVSDESRLEKVVIGKIKSGEMGANSDFTKLKDSFRKLGEFIGRFGK